MNRTPTISISRLPLLMLLVMPLMAAGCKGKPPRLRVETSPRADIVLRQGSRRIRELPGTAGIVFELDLESTSSMGPYTVEALPSGPAARNYAATARGLSSSEFERLPFRDPPDRKLKTRLLRFPLDELLPENMLEVTFVFENVRRVWDRTEIAGGPSGIPSYDEWADVRTGVEHHLLDMITKKEHDARSDGFSTGGVSESLGKLREDAQKVIDDMDLAQGTQIGKDVQLPGTQTYTRLFRYRITVQLSALSRANDISLAIAKFGSLQRRSNGGQRVEFRPTQVQVTYSTSFIEAGVTTEVVGFADAEARVYILPDIHSPTEVLAKDLGPTTWKQVYRLSPGQVWIYGFVVPKSSGVAQENVRYFRINIYTQRQETISEALFRGRPQNQ